MIQEGADFVWRGFGQPRNPPVQALKGSEAGGFDIRYGHVPAAELPLLYRAFIQGSHVAVPPIGLDTRAQQGNLCRRAFDVLNEAPIFTVQEPGYS